MAKKKATKTKNKKTKNKKQVHRVFNEFYRIRYTAYADIKTTAAYKKELMKKINYTLSFGRGISKEQKRLIKNIQNAKTTKTLIKNLDKLRQTDYGLFKKQQSQPGIGFIGRNSRNKIVQNRVIRDNEMSIFVDKQNLENEAEALIYLKNQYQNKCLEILVEYNVFEERDMHDYPDRAQRAVERLQRDIRELSDLSIDDIFFIAFH